MEIAVKTLFMGFNPGVRNSPKSHLLFIMSHMQTRDLHDGVLSFPSPWSSIHLTKIAQGNSKRATHRLFSAIQAISPDLGLENPDVSSSPFEDFTIATKASEHREIKLRVDVSGAKTQSIFDDVFSKLVTAAQPIPGFRRVKGGKTPDIPKDILLHIIGPSKVNSQTIKKTINFTVAEYVEKEGLKVTKNLRVEQSFEELEAKFQPGKDFSFDAILQLQEISSMKS